MTRKLLCLMAICLAACSSGGAYEQSYAPPAAAMSTQGTVATTRAESGNFFSQSDKPSDDADGRAATGGQGATSIDQKLVKNAQLTIQLKDEKFFEDAVKKAEGIAKALNGYVASTSQTSISFKVPSARLDEALAAVTELGKVKHRNVTAMDVTANYVDLAIRIENLKTFRVKLQELVAQGKNVEEILNVEKELARVTSQLEALEGQMRVLENQTTFATVNVYFEERVRPGPIGWVFYGLYSGVKWLFVWD